MGRAAGEMPVVLELRGPAGEVPAEVGRAAGGQEVYKETSDEE
jgi:hypothetical protein